MIEAWLSSSEKTASPGPTSAETVPRLARYPEENSSAASVPLNAASRASSSSWRTSPPVTSRADPAPAPYRRAASAAASTTSGWAASPR